MGHQKPRGSTRFAIGEIVQHRLFGYRGVIVDVDASFQMSEEWYTKMAQTRPPKNQPWYRVLVHGTEQVTYVADRNLEPDHTGEPIQHPLLAQFFNEFQQGYYSDTRSVN
ncbi:MAG: heat shock protein HspQ [Acidobacteriota bacterium]